MPWPRPSPNSRGPSVSEFIAFFLGAAVALAGTWLGYRFGYGVTHETPPPPVMGERFEGDILDFAVYPDQTADESE